MALEEVSKVWQEVSERSGRVFGGKQIPNILTKTKAERELQFSFIKDAKERKKVIDAYQWRQEEISKLEKDWVKETNTKKKNDIARNIKALVSTDPTSFEIETKGKNKGKRLYSQDHWKKGSKNPTQAHHIHGLDDYYGAWRGLEDAEHYRLTRSQARKGNFYGMHPRNRVDIDRSVHTGRTRQLSPFSDSVHGRTAHARLTTQTQMQDYIHDPANPDIGSSDTLAEPSGGKRLQVPAWSQLSGRELEDKMDWFAQRDYEAVDEIKNKPIKAPTLPGTIPSKIKDKVVSQIPSDKMSKELKGALESGDYDKAIVLADKEVPAFKEQRKIAAASKSADILSGKFNKVELVFDIIDDVSTGNYGRALLNLARHTPQGRTASITWTAANALAQSRTGMTIPERMMMTPEQRQAEALAIMEKNRQSNKAFRKNIKNFFNIDEAKKQKADADIDQRIKNIDQTTDEVWKPLDEKQEKRYRFNSRSRIKTFGRIR